ncbi:protease modulator HflC [Pseudahrensia aquimaris]|uniref:Protein HflC n=1 Tax=Pseudahrensia aquimaris TaxID=744461 RepID=A0ABW3FI48_9HYPH
MGNRLGTVAIFIAAVLLLVWSSLFIVNERQQAIVLRFGEIKRVIKDPGLYFKAPFGAFGLDSVSIVEDRLLRFDLDDIRVQVAGGKFYEVDAFLTYRISNPATFRRQLAGSVQAAESRLRSRLDAALRETYGKRGFESALSEERAVMMQEVRASISSDANDLGLTVVDVRIRRTDLTAEVSDQTFERMSAERLAEAERIRARGQEAARRITSVADREVVEIKAEAQREAEILRGEGEGERNGIFADAYSRDPEFFAFYRSMRAYEEALENAGTTMVLSPNSEFFQFFKDANGVPAAPAAGN